MARAEQLERLALGRRVTLVSIAASAVLAVANVVVGLSAGSTSVVAAGLEFLGDVLASIFVFVGMLIASKPADSAHPYGYGRYETLAGLIVGIILSAGGAGICWRSLQGVGQIYDAPNVYAIWPLLGAIVLRGIMSKIKFRVGRRINSGALVADAWNDMVDIFSAAGALVALGLTLYDPARFPAADQYGGSMVGIVVVFTGLKVLRDTSLDLADSMPEGDLMDQIRSVALGVPGVLGVDKCYARKTGLQYHVDLHLEVDPNIALWRSHEIGGLTRARLREQLDWIADVLVHVEPALGVARREPHEIGGASAPE
jgi:cation diffusion facilitator family transporter